LPNWGTDSEAVSLSPRDGGAAWEPSQAGHPGFVANRLLAGSVLVLVADWLVLLIGFVAVSRLRFGPRWIEIWDLVMPGWSLLVPLYLTAAILVAWTARSYELRPAGSVLRDSLRAAAWVASLALVSLALLFLFNRDDVSRLFLIGYFPSVLAGMVGVRSAVRRWLRRRRSAGKGLVHVLVVGSGSIAEGFSLEATAHAEAGIHIVGYLEAAGTSLLDYRRLGEVADLPVVLEHIVVDEVVVCLPLDRWWLIASVARIAEQQGKTIRIPMQVPGISNAHSRLDHLAGVPVLSLVCAPDHPVAIATKRAADVVLATVALLVLAPLMAMVAGLIAVVDGRPVLFFQRRVGLHGRNFRLVKFRTMVPDAERRLDEVAHLNERDGPVFKAARDPRMTRLGRQLRAASLDELPQFWNVLKGDMSLVGPRPALPGEVEHYDPWHRRRLSMKPGITGLWQVSNRNDPRFDSWVARDLEYIDTWSLLSDLKILLRTLPAVVRLTGR
jgi:exopolysaccharide biosynthesis polyprenyl glycosylphosphotransferase